MLIRLLLVPTLLGLLACPVPVQAATADSSAHPPTLVVRVQSLDDLLADVKYLANLAGRPEAARQLDEAIRKRFPKGFDGVDSKRPLGLYGRLDPEENLMDTILVALVPVADEKAFVGLLERFSELKAQKEADGIYRLKPENAPVPFYVRFAHGYAYLTAREKAALAPDKLLDPGKLFAARSAGLLAGTFHLDHIPAGIKQIVISKAELAVADAEDQKPAGETEAQHGLKVQALKDLHQQLTSLLRDGGEVMVRLDVNRQAKELAAELTVAGKPGSKAAGSIAALARSRSRVAGLLTPDAALNLLVHGPMPGDLGKRLGSVLDEELRKAMANEKNPAQRAAGEKFFAALLLPTFQSGELDAAVSLRGPSAQRHYTLVAGARVTDGEQVARAFREFWKSLPEADRSKIQLDAEAAGSVPIHRIKVESDLDPEARRNFGSNPFYLAFRPDAAFVAGGENGLAALKEALAAPPAAGPPLELSLAVARMAPTMPSTKGDPAEAAAKAFGGPGKGNDQLRITVQGGNALQVRLSLKAAVLSFFRLLDKQGAAGR